MDTDLDTLATALYVVTDDLLVSHPDRLPPRPKIEIAPRSATRSCAGWQSSRRCWGSPASAGSSVSCVPARWRVR